MWADGGKTSLIGNALSRTLQGQLLSTVWEDMCSLWDGRGQGYWGLHARLWNKKLLCQQRCVCVWRAVPEIHRSLCTGTDSSVTDGQSYTCPVSSARPTRLSPWKWLDGDHTSVPWWEVLSGWSCRCAAISLCVTAGTSQLVMQHLCMWLWKLFGKVYSPILQQTVFLAVL